MRPAWALIALALAVGIQSALTTYFPIAAVVFDFFLILATYYALTTNQVTGMLVGTVCGLVQDALGAPPFGQNAFAKTLIGYVVGGLGRRFEFSLPVTHLLVLAGATFLQAVVVFIVHLVLGLPADFPSWKVLLTNMFGNGVMGMAIYAVVLRRRERRS